MKPETAEPHVHRMLVRFAEAGDEGIEGRYVPIRILNVLQEREHVAFYEDVYRITPAGRAKLAEERG
jgi:hypothetical protein